MCVALVQRGNEVFMEGICHKFSGMGRFFFIIQNSCRCSAQHSAAYTVISQLGSNVIQGAVALCSSSLHFFGVQCNGAMACCGCRCCMCLSSLWCFLCCFLQHFEAFVETLRHEAFKLKQNLKRFPTDFCATILHDRLNLSDNLGNLCYYQENPLLIAMPITI